ncbi:hypothetical protein ACFWOL_25215 [Streptomyces sp. NPDC058442]|uniref:hypothetical protein n=1 Tax=Streptomyces sp. NPDC058442 TaxID=3346503 RepID=UPI0036639E8B
MTQSLHEIEPPPDPGRFSGRCPGFVGELWVLAQIFLCQNLFLANGARVVTMMSYSAAAGDLEPVQWLAGVAAGEADLNRVPRSAGSDTWTNEGCAAVLLAAFPARTVHRTAS